MKSEKEQDDKEVYTPEELAKKLRVGSATVRRWLRDGEIKALKLGRQWRIEKKEYDAFLKMKREEHQGS